MSREHIPVNPLRKKFTKKDDQYCTNILEQISLIGNFTIGNIHFLSYQSLIRSLHFRNFTHSLSSLL